MKIPTQRQFETAKMVHQVKEPDNLIAKLDYTTFTALWDAMYNPKRHWQVVCAVNPQHTVTIVRRGYVVEDAFSGDETDGDMSLDDSNCEECSSTATVVDEYALEDFIGEGKC